MCWFHVPLESIDRYLIDPTREIIEYYVFFCMCASFLVLKSNIWEDTGIVCVKFLYTWLSLTSLHLPAAVCAFYSTWWRDEANWNRGITLLFIDFLKKLFICLCYMFLENATSDGGISWILLRQKNHCRANPFGCAAFPDMYEEGPEQKTSSSHTFVVSDGVRG